MHCIYNKENILWNINFVRMRRKKKSMIVVCNIWMICLDLNWFFYDPSRILQLSEFVWTVRSSVFKKKQNNFLLRDTTDRSKINSDHHRIFFKVSIYPLSFFVNTPFKVLKLEMEATFQLIHHANKGLQQMCILLNGVHIGVYVSVQCEIKTADFINISL